jgi:hypothetical protein
MKYAPVPVETERVASETIAAAIEVQPDTWFRLSGEDLSRSLVPGALLACELIENEKAIAVTYKGIAIPGQRVDLVVHPVFVLCVASTTARAS